MKFLILLFLIFLSSCSTISVNKSETYDPIYASHYFDLAQEEFKSGNFNETIKLCDFALKNLLLAERENLKTEELNYYDRLTDTICRLRLRACKKLYQKKENKNSVFPLEYHERVGKWLAYYTGNGKKYLEKWLERSKYYYEMMKEILKKYNMPEELACVPIVESGSHPFAVSPKRAVGLWQFILPTGKRYGLERNHWYDERRDPEKSTIAACKMLKNLYNEFGDWLLALAAYNCGTYRVRKAIKTQKTKNFWDLYLPRETENYVAKIIAVAMIMDDPLAFGFDNEKGENIRYDVVQVYGPVDLKLVSNLIDVNLKELLFLNPELTRQCTPPDVIPYPLKIPQGKSAEFVKKFSKLPARKKYLSKKQLQARKHNVIIYRVRRGDNLWKIAKKYRVSVRKLKKWNRIARADRIYPGQKLKIYR
ncbi:MAG: transglycosylase SLT domain-containing protein [Elusimicrobia bacterium]|nr:transglycosylase SLT domain-containing protein [Elusimicrobiota bacterium]